MDEIWIELKGEYEGIKLSNLGRVKSLRGKLLKTNRVCRTHYVMLYLASGKRKTINLMNLVAECFVPNPNNFPKWKYISEDLLDSTAASSIKWYDEEEEHEFNFYPNRSELKQDFEQCLNSISSIGRKYGISPSTITKLARQYGLTEEDRASVKPVIERPAEEVLKVIKGTGDRYLISNRGYVKSIVTGKILRVSSNGNVGMYVNRRVVVRGVAKLVATYFLPNPSNLKTVMLIDGSANNFAVENIAWSRVHKVKVDKRISKAVLNCDDKFKSFVMDVYHLGLEKASNKLELNSSVGRSLLKARNLPTNIKKLKVLIKEAIVQGNLDELIKADECTLSKIELLPGEQALTPNGFSNYKVTNFGRIISSLQAGGEHLLAPSRGVSMKNDTTGLFQHVTVSRIVAELFIGKMPEGAKLIHVDGDPLNSHVNNLKYIGGVGAIAKAV